jgi:hypothetical protein
MTTQPNNVILRTVGYWKQFYANNKKEGMLLNMVIFEKNWKDDTKVSYEEITAAMALRGNKCLHDTDLSLHNTRRDAK